MSQKEQRVLSPNSLSTPIKQYDKRYRAVMTHIETGTDQKSANLYESWRHNPHIVMKEPDNFSNNQTFRNTHNNLYKTMVQPVADTVLGNKMLTTKTYFNSLKDHIAMIPKNPVFNKDRVSNARSICSP